MFLLTVLMVLSIGYSQELGQWRWANDTIELTHDKEAHLVGSFGLYYLFRHKEFNETESIWERGFNNNTISFSYRLY
jgi:hypothetical protein